ncbi:profilin, required for normal timing of actin polymerization in response to thermal stress [Gryganskiella cystojenkinii]|nr:profilin, required for normal timing of actin polymerization in response to thermal stress [Gryganskiella cystojenkinii]
MSWQSYVDNNLVATGKVSKGAIFGLDGSQWAVSTGFSVDADEVNKLVAAFDSIDGVAAGGLFLGHKKYVLLRNDPGRSIYARLGSTGVCCVKTSQAVIVGYYDENIQSGDCTVIVEALADYLRSVGYQFVFLISSYEMIGKDETQATEQQRPPPVIPSDNEDQT